MFISKYILKLKKDYILVQTTLLFTFLRSLLNRKKLNTKLIPLYVYETKWNKNSFNNVNLNT